MSVQPWKRENLAWVAGVIEGDGCITLKGKYKNTPVVSVVMSDEDVLLRCKEWTGLGTVYGPYWPPNGKNIKGLYTWAVGGGAHAYALLAAIYPWLGDRRKTRAAEVMKVFNNKQILNRYKTVCKSGHPFNTQNTHYSLNRRHCRVCRAEAGIRFRSKLCPKP